MPEKKKAKTQRLMKFLLTDGMKEIIGMEASPLRDIDFDNLLPGTKFRLYGPIIVRRGIWFIEPGNIEILWTNTGKLVIEKEL